MNEQDDLTLYKVVLNHEEQYSIWPADRENALGWRDEGFRGNKTLALAYIKEQWTDMRPLSLRVLMDNARQPVTTANAPSVAPASMQPAAVVFAAPAEVSAPPAAANVAPAAVSIAPAEVSIPAPALQAAPTESTSIPDSGAPAKRGWFSRWRKS